MIQPHGGILVDRRITQSELKRVQRKRLKEVQINSRNVSDCEMIGIGAYSPIKGFMTKSEVQTVLNEMQLLNGMLWSIPIVLNVNPNDYNSVKIGEEIILSNKDNIQIALLKVSEKYLLDLEDYCRKIFLTTSKEHPGISMTYDFGGHFLAGKIKLINTIHNDDIAGKYYLEPKDTREIFRQNNWENIVAFQTRNPIHRAHEYIVKCALENHDGLLIHPLVGETKNDDIPSSVRMKCYEILIEKYFNSNRTVLSVMPAAMRYAGPREAIHHLIIRQNYGCTHMIIGRDHAGVGNYYSTYQAQDLVRKVRTRLKIQPMFFENAFYCKDCQYVVTTKTCPHSESSRINLSGTKVREMLRNGQKPPEEFTRAEVSKILIASLS